ncbi:hypothetical protein [Mesobacillus subterraneus]|uniref:hypothetical protein n=1 Tax=Mesobacillus subterraneus TaxID=285983 RepID=UPI001CFDE496|nr:hypothetical protein [Mesobacillus subterraneus]
MEEIEGIIILQDEIVTVNEIPVSKIFLNFNGKRVKLLLSCGTDTSYEFEGIADLFYYEGNQPYYRGTKYVNDFFIGPSDILEVLEKHTNELVKIKMMSYWESLV